MGRQAPPSRQPAAPIEPLPAGPLVLAETTVWHEDARGFFELAAGTPVRAVRNLQAEVQDLAERMAFEKLLERDRAAGGSPVLVWLEGRVRAVERRQVVAVAAELRLVG